MRTHLVVHLVEDDDSARDSLAFLLRTAKYSVETFATGAEYLAIQEVEHPACLVTDLRMPGVGGLELIRLLRERQSQVPIIVITGDGDEHLAEAARKTGASAVLYKPFDAERLLAAVDASIVGA